MKKSVYSVVLSDDVIKKIDKLAYNNGTNRSNMINQILADYVSLTTPEKRIRTVFEQLAELLYSTETFSELAPPTSSVMSVRSALAYKYNPTVKYAIELYREPSDVQGVIKVSTRTTNSDLLTRMLNFYNIWVAIEKHYGFDGAYSYENGVFKRPIIHRTTSNGVGFNQNIGAGMLIANYISVFDNAMKMYFEDPDNTENISKIYCDYITENSEVI